MGELIRRINQAKVFMWITIILLFLEIYFYALPACLPFAFWIFNDNTTKYSLEEFAAMGDAFGIFNTLFSALAFLGLICTIYLQIRDASKQSVTDKFYKMLDFQETLVSQITVLPITIDKRVKHPEQIQGRKAFVQYKIQLKYLMKVIQEISEENTLGLSKVDIADISYAVFYYGSAPTWQEFMRGYLKDYPNTDRLVRLIVEKLQKTDKYALHRTNQNYLSVYYRNLYNTIKLIDTSTSLAEEEKKQHIKILRARLCNSELYVLFFNVISRFGRKWIENDYIEHYQLIQNLPPRYCDGYDPKEYFPKVRFEEEETCLSWFHDRKGS